MSNLITGEVTSKLDIDHEKGLATCVCGHEFPLNKFYAHLLYFGWVCCDKCGTTYTESDS